MQFCSDDGGFQMSRENVYRVDPPTRFGVANGGRTSSSPDLENPRI
jgi:hypothetical protein